MTSSAGGLDVLVMTGGIGEHAPVVAATSSSPSPTSGWCRPGTQRGSDADADVTAAGATARTVVVTASEETEVARQVTQLLRG